MKKQKVFNDFETLSTYNFINNKSSKNNNKSVVNSSKTNREVGGELNSQQQFVPSVISVCSPTNIEEVNSAIISLKNNQPIILDLSYKKETLTQKVLNYLNGAVYALNGSINKLKDNTYLILPQGVNINLS